MRRRSGRTRPRLSRRRREALLAVIAALKLRFGEHIVRFGADMAALPGQSDWPLSTGSAGLDLLVGGLRRGHITEYAGLDGAGVETLAMSALAACQRAGGLVLLVDADGAVDPDALVAVGVDVSALILSAPTTAREAWAVLMSVARCGALDLLVLASLPGLLALPQDGWGSGPGIGVRALERRLWRVRWALHGRSTALLLINRPVRRSTHASGAPVGRDEGGEETIGGPAITQAAALRVLLTPERLALTPYGDIAALCASARVLKHHGLARTPPVQAGTILTR